MEHKATAKYMRICPYKVRLVACNVRGLPVEQALNVLRFTPKKAAQMLNKVLDSAVANAEQLPGVDVDALKIKSVVVNEGPTIKRYMARAMGRVSRIRKRSSHITVVLEEM